MLKRPRDAPRVTPRDGSIGTHHRSGHVQTNGWVYRQRPATAVSINSTNRIVSTPPASARTAGRRPHRAAKPAPASPPTGRCGVRCAISERHGRGAEGDRPRTIWSGRVSRSRGNELHTVAERSATPSTGRIWGSAADRGMLVLVRSWTDGEAARQSAAHRATRGAGHVHRF